MFTPQEEEVATQAAELLGSIFNVMPAMEAAKADAYLELIGTKLKEVAARPVPENKIKDITENVVDVMEAIGNVLPHTDDPKKARQQKRYKAVVGMVSNITRLFGLN